MQILYRLVEDAKARFPRSSKTKQTTEREAKEDLFEEDAEDGLPKFELLSRNPRADSVTSSKVSATSTVLADWIDCSEEMAASKNTLLSFRIYYLRDTFLWQCSFRMFSELRAFVCKPERLM